MTVALSIQSVPYYSLRNTIKDDTGYEVFLSLTGTVMKWCKRQRKYAGLYGRLSHHKQDTTEFALKRERLSQEGQTSVSADETSLTTNGRLVHWYAKKSEPLFARERQAKFTMYQRWRQCNHVVACVLLKRKDRTKDYPSVKHSVAPWSHIAMSGFEKRRFPSLKSGQGVRSCSMGCAALRASSASL